MRLPVITLGSLKFEFGGENVENSKFGKRENYRFTLWVLVKKANVFDVKFNMDVLLKNVL